MRLTGPQAGGPGKKSREQPPCTREEHPEHAQATAALIEEALGILRQHPLIGRPAEAGFHELLISRGRTGYVALYEYRASTDQVLVHRIRHQREAGLEEE